MFLSFEKSAAYKKIYHRKWNTEENEVYHQQIFTICGIDNSKIPVSWSREIYELIRAIQERYPAIKILNIKEKQYELEFYFTLPEAHQTESAETWIAEQVNQTKIILILKNAYLFTHAQIKNSDKRIEPSKLKSFQRSLASFSADEIDEIQNREPEYQDDLLLEEPLPKSEIDEAYAYLHKHLPDWRTKLYFQEKQAENNKDPRLEIMLHLAAKYSGFRPLSIASSEEILSLDKFSTERTRAIFGKDIALQLSLKFYEKGDREGLEQLKDGQLTHKIKELETELIQDKEKSILIENVIAFYKLREKETLYTKAI